MEIQENGGMKIVIDLTSLSYHLTGIERYALCITKEMLNIDCENTYVLIFRDTVYSDFSGYIDGKRVCSKILYGNNKLLFYQVILPYALYGIKADKYLFLAFTSPVLFWRKGIVNTIHDMGVWDCPSSMKFLQRLYFKAAYRIAAFASWRILTVSEFSRKRIETILKIPGQKLEVVHSALTKQLKEANTIPYKKVKLHYHLPDHYIMALSTIEPRKNLPLLLEAYDKIKDSVDYDLVLVGRTGWKMNDVITRYSDKSRIHLTGFIPDEEVAQIYRNALCFVFPSLYEGFGLPPMEALALGTPVISSDAASMPEILQDRAVYFENNNKEALVELLLQLPDRVKQMPVGWNDYQRRNFNFETSALKLHTFLNTN